MKFRKKAFLAASLLTLTAGAAFADTLFKSSAVASYYADKFHGRKTSNGEVFNMYDLTAAHKSLPFGTLVKVTNLGNGKSVTVRINDRGPFVKGREIDLSKAAAVQLDMIKAGTARVSLAIVDGSGGKDSWHAYDAAAGQKWDIQLGAYSKKSNAQALAHKLQSAGFSNVAYQTVGNITRVVLRDIPTDSVESYLESLERKGFSDYLVRERPAPGMAALR